MVLRGPIMIEHDRARASVKAVLGCVHSRILVSSRELRRAEFRRAGIGSDVSASRPQRGARRRPGQVRIDP